MKIFFKNILLFLLLSVILLSLWGFLVDKGLRKSQYFYYAQWNNIYSNGKINADLIIIGSSRAVSSYSPQILDSILSINSYNIGINGYGVSMQSSKYNVYIAHNKLPKFVLYNIEDISLRDRSDLYQKEQFSPYLDDPIIKNEVVRYKGFQIYDFYNPFTKYLFQKEAWIGVGELLGMHMSFDGYKGYKAQDIAWNHTFERVRKENPNGITILSGEKEKQKFEETVKEMKKQKINIIFVYAPQYIEGQKLMNNLPEAVSFYHSIADKYSIPYISYLEDSICLSKENFYDSQHLNKHGSEIFTEKLATDLKELLSFE